MWTLTLGRNLSSIYFCGLGSTASKKVHKVVQMEQYCTDNPSVCSYVPILQCHQPLHQLQMHIQTLIGTAAAAIATVNDNTYISVDYTFQNLSLTLYFENVKEKCGFGVAIQLLILQAVFVSCVSQGICEVICNSTIIHCVHNGITEFFLVFLRVATSCYTCLLLVLLIWGAHFYPYAEIGVLQPYRVE